MIPRSLAAPSCAICLLGSDHDGFHRRFATVWFLQCYLSSGGQILQVCTLYSPSSSLHSSFCCQTFHGPSVPPSWSSPSHCLRPRPHLYKQLLEISVQGSWFRASVQLSVPSSDGRPDRACQPVRRNISSLLCAHLPSLVESLAVPR